MAVDEIPVGAYVDLTTGEVVDAEGQTAITAAFAVLYALLPDPLVDSASVGSGSGQGSPDFDALRPEMVVTLRAELAALRAAIAAAPTS